jgi:hypothetical protein
VCHLEVTGVPSIFKVIRKAAALSRMCPTLDLSYEENTDHTTVVELVVGLDKMNS